MFPSFIPGRLEVAIEIRELDEQAIGPHARLDTSPGVDSRYKSRLPIDSGMLPHEDQFSRG